MTIRAARVASISRDIEVLLAETLSPDARSDRLAAFAREALDDAKDQNRAVLGRVPEHRSFVDGRESDDFDAVRPDGRIVVEFDLLDGVLEWIGDELVKMSPVLTGTYARSHILLIDGVEHVPGAALPDAFESATFANTVEYARKIERGQSPQASEGVYEAVAAVAANRFGNIAKVRYTFRSLTGADKRDRQPAIVVTL